MVEDAFARGITLPQPPADAVDVIQRLGDAPQGEYHQLRIGTSPDRRFDEVLYEKNLRR